MKTAKHCAFILFFGIISLTISRAMHVVGKEDWNGPSRAIMENPPKKVHDESSLLISMPAETDEPATAENHDELIPVSGHEKNIPVFTVQELQIKIEFPIGPNNDTMDTSANNDSVNNSALDSEDSIDNVSDDSTVIYPHPQANTLTVATREFYECVSCNSDFRARKHYDVCLQKLSLKNQETIQSCCNVSFDSEFCSKASTGIINYKTICEDPEKALMVSHCFWGKIEDKETDDIKMYRECKRGILDRYCRATSPSNIVRYVVNEPIQSDIH